MKIARKWLSGCLTILLAAACQPSMTQTKMASSPKPRVASEPVQTIQTACKNLHKVVDIDDLLKQMYDNLDSQCLFEMPTAELEKIWGIRIFDFVEFQNTAVNNLTPEQLEIYNPKFNQVIEDVRQHFNNNNAIYLEKNGGGNFAPSAKNNPEIIWFQIHTTPAHRKAYSQYTWFSGSVDLGQFPKYLPKPSEIILSEYIRLNIPKPPVHHTHYDPSSVEIPQDTVYQEDSQYIWRSAEPNSKLPALVIRTDEDTEIPDKISFYNFYQPK